MKRIFALLFMYLFSTSVFAADAVRVPGVWAFAIGSTQGNYFRLILDQANKDQKKYEFFFDHRPGAGGSISNRHVLAHQGPAILAHSAAFFARPYLFPNASDTPYRLDQFKPILVMGEAPAVLMTKGKTIEQLMKQPRVTIGTSGPGTSTHLMAETLKKYLKNSEVDMVHFNDSNQAYLNVLGGHIDAAFEFLGDAKAKATKDVTFAGLTGAQTVEGIKPLKNLGMTDMEFVGGVFAIYVPVTMPAEVYNEIRAILLKAEQAEAVQALYRRDYTFRDPALLKTPALQPWYDVRVKRFQGLTAGIKMQ